MLKVSHFVNKKTGAFLFLLAAVILLSAFPAGISAGEIEYEVSALYNPDARTFAGEMAISFSPSVLDHEGNLHLELYANRYAQAANDMVATLRALGPFDGRVRPGPRS